MVQAYSAGVDKGSYRFMNKDLQARQGGIAGWFESFARLFMRGNAPVHLALLRSGSKV